MGNNDSLFPSKSLHPHDPIPTWKRRFFHRQNCRLTQMRGKKPLYKVRWKGEGPEGDIWLPADELAECDTQARVTRHYGQEKLALILFRSFCPTSFDAPVLCTLSSLATILFLSTHFSFFSFYFSFGHTRLIFDGGECKHITGFGCNITTFGSTRIVSQYKRLEHHATRLLEYLDLDLYDHYHARSRLSPTSSFLDKISVLSLSVPGRSTEVTPDFNFLKINTKGANAKLRHNV